MKKLFFSLFSILPPDPECHCNPKHSKKGYKKIPCQHYYYSSFVKDEKKRLKITQTIKNISPPIKAPKLNLCERAWPSTIKERMYSPVFIKRSDSSFFSLSLNFIKKLYNSFFIKSIILPQILYQFAFKLALAKKGGDESKCLGFIYNQPKAEIKFKEEKRR